MKPIGHTPPDLNPKLKEMLSIVRSDDRSDAALEQMQTLKEGLTGNELEIAGSLIEAFNVDRHMT